MATLREIRNRIGSIESTQQITKAMKMVSSAKLRKAQDRILALRPYAYELRNVIRHLVALIEDVSSLPLIRKRPVNKALIVVVTSDRGLCGAFNSNIIRTVIKRLNEYSQTDTSLYIIGRKGYEYFSRRDKHIEKYKPEVFQDICFDNAARIARDLVSLYLNGGYDRIEIVYNEFKSAIQQNVIHEQFLPFEPEEESEEGASESVSKVDFLYEPDKATLVNQLIPKNLNIQFWRILLESNAAEQGARMTAMESATDNAEELIHQLTIYYNRTRQAAITKELSEIVGGANALKES
ncbi:MAG: ATP synthase F1 subunit gamma [Calditrichaceae bacterium]|nr:ATP synthase F1 subunit gamma [Calditrichaceae bacterium]MBN2707525.1 ATP synthase F1 subunit gamma [Calditrichaceae bacterium]RQV95614.1 MAG: ATP synthase F1 subunit gamma [Calditrichota bacterium]